MFTYKNFTVSVNNCILYWILCIIIIRDYCHSSVSFQNCTTFSKVNYHFNIYPAIKSKVSFNFVGSYCHFIICYIPQATIIILCSVVCMRSATTFMTKMWWTKIVVHGDILSLHSVLRYANLCCYCTFDIK